MTNAPLTFTVSFNADDAGYIVHEASNAYSFAMIPSEHQYYFGNDKAKANDQVRRLHAHQAKGNEIKMRLIETPGRFEKVADKKYGCAW